MKTFMHIPTEQRKVFARGGVNNSMINRLKIAIFLRLTADIFVNPVAIEVLSHELDSLPE